MMKLRGVPVLLGAIAFACGVLPPLAQACDVQVGQRIVLASMSPDPDVFVWDSRSRLVDYAAGVVDGAKAVMAHTALAKPGTRAVVTTCITAAIKPRYVVANYDAIRIKLLSGTYRGRYGWVTSEDVHTSGAYSLDRR